MELLHYARTRIIAPGLIIAFLLYFFHASFTSPREPAILDDLDRPPISTPPPPGLNPGDPVTDHGDYAFLPPSLSAHFPAPDAERKDYREWNAKSMRELHVCMALDTCGKNQRKIALLAAHWFEQAVVRGWRGGEGVWGLSMYKHLKAMGYTTLFATSFPEALAIYRLFPSLIRVVIRNKAGECHADPSCVKSKGNPTGIPAWKIFDFEYFPSTNGGHYHASLMGGKWVLSAHPERGGGDVIQYIGFSVEDACTSRPFIPPSQRQDRIFMLMKQLTYVYDTRFAWNTSYFALASAALGMPFVGAWLVDQSYQWDPKKQGEMEDIEDRERGVVNLLNGDVLSGGEERGFKKEGWGEEKWAREVGKSRAMLGMGNPWWSPSPYHALCAGVPFINPILNFDPADPWNKTKWYTQHPSLVQFDPPYVYHVHARNYTGFLAALRSATDTPIPSFIPSHMTEEAVRERVRGLMERDWREAGRVLLEERRIEEGGYVFEL